MPSAARNSRRRATASLAPAADKVIVTISQYSIGRCRCEMAPLSHPTVPGFGDVVGRCSFAWPSRAEPDRRYKPKGRLARTSNWTPAKTLGHLGRFDKWAQISERY